MWQMSFSFTKAEVLFNYSISNHRHDYNADEGKNLKLVDAPVSGGVQRASLGTLTV